MKKLPWAIAIAAFGLSVVVSFRAHVKVTELEKRSEVLRQYCMATKDAFLADWLAFASGDPTKREAAYVRFYDGVTMHHNVSSFMMCSSKEPPNMPLHCTVDKDWDCLANLAKEMKDLLP